MVLDAMTDALCTFLDTHYFLGNPNHDDMVANSKAEELLMDDIDPKGGKGGKGANLAEDDGWFAETDSAENMLHAYEHIIREGGMMLPTHDLPPPVDIFDVTTVETHEATQQMAPAAPVLATPSEPLPPPATPVAKAAKANKKAAAKTKPAKAKAPPANAVPRAVALNKAAAPKAAKAKAVTRLAKKASARIAVSVRI